MREYLSPKEAVEHYGLRVEPEKLSEFGSELARSGIAAVEMPLSPDDFRRFSEGFAVALNECPEQLKETLCSVDSRYGSEAGYVRKEAKTSQTTGIQTSDPKNLFHFTEEARHGWRQKFKNGPKVLRDFLEDGYEIHNTLISVSEAAVTELETSHPHISNLYYPRDESFTFLRLLRYDGYEPHDDMLDVASPHFDISGVTLQAYADAPGFWGAPDGKDGVRYHQDTSPHEGYVFLGKGHEKVYGNDDPLKPLYHGVDRVIEAGMAWVPERTAVILFIDAPEVDYKINEHDTRPYLERHMANRALRM